MTPLPAALAALTVVALVVVVDSARYEPVNRVSIAVKGDATEQLASVRDDAKRATIMRL